MKTSSIKETNISQIDDVCLLKDLQELLHANHIKISEIKYAIEKNTEHNFKLVIRENLDQ